MIGLLPIHKVIGYFAVAYAVIVAVIIFFVVSLSQSLDLVDAVKVAFLGLGLLPLLIFGALSFGWRWLWKLFPALNDLLFPDIGGRWKMRIEWHGLEREGIVNASVTIKQNFTQMSMEVSSPGSESETLIALPRKDPQSGRPILYYVYRVVPNSINSDAGHPYEGSAILKLAKPGELSGNYFTSKNTRGHFRLTRDLKATA